MPFATSNQGFTQAGPMTYGSHVTWTYTTGTVKLFSDYSSVKIRPFFFLPFVRIRFSNLGFTAAGPLTYGAHLTWTYTTETVYFPASFS